MARTKMGFKDKVKTNTEKQKKEAKQYGYLNLPEDVDVFKVEPDSKVRLDILPYRVTDENHPDKDEESGIAVVDEYWWRRPFKIHRLDGETVVCRTSFGKKCPICDYYKKRQNEGADKEELAALKPKQRVMYAVIPIDEEDYEEKPHVFEMSYHTFQKQLNQELEEDEDYMAFPELEGGYTLRIRFSGEPLPNSKNKFAKANRIDFEERDEDYTDEILDEVPNLDELISLKSEEELYSLLHGEDADDAPEIHDPDEEEDETPKRKTRRKKKVEPEDNEEPENEYADDEPEDEEDEEDEKDAEPKRTTRRKRKRVNE